MPNQPPSPDTPVHTQLGGETRLLPADTGELVQALAFALRYQGRRRVDTAGQAMARITAERLVEHLQAAGFVLMRRPTKLDGPDMHYGPSAARAWDEQ